MALAGHDPHVPETAPHDGAVRCALCSEPYPTGPGPEWCALSSSLLCEKCCDALQEGDPRRVLPLILRSKGKLRLEQAVALCLECPRMAYHAVKHAPGAEAVPPC